MFLFKKDSHCKHCGWNEESHDLPKEKLDAIYKDNIHEKNVGHKKSLINCPGFEKGIGLSILGTRHWHR